MIYSPVCRNLKGQFTNAAAPAGSVYGRTVLMCFKVLDTTWGGTSGYVWAGRFSLALLAILGTRVGESGRLGSLA